MTVLPETNSLSTHHTPSVIHRPNLSDMLLISNLFITFQSQAITSTHSGFMEIPAAYKEFSSLISENGRRTDPLRMVKRPDACKHGIPLMVTSPGTY